MKRPILFAFLSALAVAANAQSATPTPDAVAVPTAETQQDAADQSVAGQDKPDRSTPDQNAGSKTRPLSDHNCLRQTGSRIPRTAKGEGCTNAAGRAYTREELDGTGGRDLAHSLRLLDPAIQ